MRTLGSPTLPCAEVDTKDHSLFTILYQAIRDARYRVPHLELGCASYGVPLSTLEPRLHNPAFNNLKVLHLAIEPTQQEIADDNTGELERLCRWLDQFEDFLQECHNLETLVLTRTHYNLARTFSILVLTSLVRLALRDASSAGAFRKLESFSIEGFAFTWMVLKRFVSVTRSSLKSLTVSNGSVRRYRNPVEAVRQIHEAYGGDDLQLHGEVFGEVFIDQESDGLFD